MRKNVLHWKQKKENVDLVISNDIHSTNDRQQALCALCVHVYMCMGLPCIFAGKHSQQFLAFLDGHKKDDQNLFWGLFTPFIFYMQVLKHHISPIYNSKACAHV